jgi:hypothetical protein
VCNEWLPFVSPFKGRASETVKTCFRMLWKDHTAWNDPPVSCLPSEFDVEHNPCICLLRTSTCNISNYCTKLNFCAPACFGHLFLPSLGRCGIKKTQALRHMSVNGKHIYTSIIRQSVDAQCYWKLFRLKYSMEQSPSWEANSKLCR